MEKSSQELSSKGTYKIKLLCFVTVHLQREGERERDRDREINQHSKPRMTGECQEDLVEFNCHWEYFTFYNDDFFL